MTLQRRHFIRLLPALAIGQASRGSAAEPLNFGVVPQKPPAALAADWAPFVAWLARRSGVALRFATGSDIPAFEERLRAGAYDFAYMNPLHYAVFHRTLGFEALAHAADQPLRGILVVHKDAPLQELRQLEGQVLAFPAPASFAATVLPLGELSRRAIQVTPRFVNSHDSVYIAISSGLFPAGGGVMSTLQAMPAQMQSQLRVLWTSAAFTPHPFAVRPGIDPTAVQRVRDALLLASKDEEGQALLKGIGIRGIAAARDSEYDDVRALPLDRLASLLRS